MNTIEVGTKMVGRQINYLPPTTRVNFNGVPYVRKQNGRWMQVGYPSNNWTWRDFLGDQGVVTVTFIPVPAEKPSSPDEHFDVWEARFLAAVRRGAENNGVRTETINRAFRDIGLDLTRQVEGPRNPGEYGYGDLPSAPEGSIVSTVSAGMVYKKSGHYWYRMTPNPERRERNLPPEAWMLVRWGADGPATVADMEPVTEAERTRLRQVKARAWKVAMRMKSQHGWCSTLESIVNAGGVYATDAMGDGLDKYAQARQPEGTYLFWQNVLEPAEWVVLVRDNRMRNIATTRRMFGSVNNNTADACDIIARPGEEWVPPAFQVPIVQNALRHIAQPDRAGLLLTVDASEYVVCQDGTISGRSEAGGGVPAHGRWTHASFGAGQGTIRIESIGGTE